MHMDSLKKFVEVGAHWSGDGSDLLDSRSIQFTLSRLADLWPTREAQQRRGIRVSVYRLAAGNYKDRSIRAALASLVDLGLIARVRDKKPGTQLDSVARTYINPLLVDLSRDWVAEQRVLRYPRTPTKNTVDLARFRNEGSLKASNGAASSPVGMQKNNFSEPTSDDVGFFIEFGTNHDSQLLASV